MVDAARAILDGHIVLSRNLVDQGVYPAIDVGSSISRLMTKLVDAEQLQLASRFKQLWQCYQEQRDLIAIGAYQAGSDPLTDEAIRLYPSMCEFLAQFEGESVSAEEGLSGLRALLAPPTTIQVPMESSVEMP